MDILNDITKMIEDSSDPGNDIHTLKGHIESLHKLLTEKSVAEKFKPITDLLENMNFNEVYHGNWSKYLNKDLSIHAVFGPFQRVYISVLAGDWSFSQESFSPTALGLIEKYIDGIKFPSKKTYSVHLSGDFYFETQFRDWAYEQLYDEELEINSQ